MKQILLATTALVMTAGVAAAEISFSGYAEMGIEGGGDDAFNGTGGTTQFSTDFDLIVTMTSETDTGLAFGTSFAISTNDRDERSATGEPEHWSNAGLNLDNEAAFISGAFGTLTMGEIDGAMDWAMTENVGNPGSIADDETTHAGYFGAYGDGKYDNQIARYEYSFGDFGVAVSAELDDTDTNGDGYAVGLKYKADLGGFGMGFGLAYQSLETTGTGLGSQSSALNELANDVDGGEFVSGDVELVGASVNADFNNGLVAGLAYTDISSDTRDGSHLGVSAGFTTGAFEIGANYGVFDMDGLDKIKGYGVAAAYDLGGGLKVHAGYGDSDLSNGAAGDGDFDTYSVGVSMSF
ncbi:porin [Cereibacter johrii]|uniref:porin n=1 Tax=Cereibacter johrii TaxID=445629 RepID=UPI000DCBE86A|nr:porin [Cereibacter johrii]RAZ86270.1 porin [Cereibacter johrii]